MDANLNLPFAPGRNEFDLVLRGDLTSAMASTDNWKGGRVLLHLALLFLGAGLYGVAMGWWRDPRQALFTAIKLPLILVLTAAGNALLNALLAPLLGLNVRFRQSFLAILMSFAMAAVILGTFSPLTAFLAWNAPSYSPILLTHVAVIAFAGVAANARLLALLRQLSRDRIVARRVLFAWLAGNLFLGAQLSWIFRPFVGSPGLPVQFLRDDPLDGNFYESVFRLAAKLLNPQ